MTEPGERQYKPWQYPKKWFGEEKFWFDMFTRTISAIVAAIVLLVGAKVGGLLGDVKWGDIWRSIAASGASISAVVSVLGVIVAAYQTLKTRRQAIEAEKNMHKMAQLAREQIERRRTAHE